MREHFTGIVVNPGSLNDGRMKTIDAPQLKLIEGRLEITGVSLVIGPSPHKTTIPTCTYRHTVLVYGKDEYSFWVPLDRDDAWLMASIMKGYRK